MKKIIFCIAAALILSTADAQQLRTPAPSPTQTIKQDFGLSNVELTYSRPVKRGRVIFGELVPYGKVWRTGANAATTITFGDEVTIGGKKVPAGKYGLLTIPDKDNWTVIITKQLDVNNPSLYKVENDVARVSVKPVALTGIPPIESFTIQFGEVKSNTLDLQLMWDKTAVVVPITTDVESKVMAQIDQQMNKDNKPYYNAAMYYMENGKDLNQALAWFDKAAEMNPTAYWIHYNRANCLSKLGKKKEAKEAATKSKELATKADNQDYVKLNNDLLATLN